MCVKSCSSVVRNIQDFAIHNLTSLPPVVLIFVKIKKKISVILLLNLLLSCDCCLMFVPSEIAL